MSLTARLLEENGIATVILGSARDIVEHCGVPRFQFTNFPLGNPCGVPYDHDMQQQIIALTLDLLSSANVPGSTALTPYHWPGEDTWRDNYSRVSPENRQQLKEMGERRRQKQASDKTSGQVRND